MRIHHDQNLQSRKLEIVREGLRNDIRLIRELMKRNGFGNIVLGKICGILAPIPVIGPFFGLPNALYNTFRKPQPDVSFLKVAYAAFYQEQLAGVKAT